MNVHLAFLIWEYYVRVWLVEWRLKMIDFLEIIKVLMILKKYAEIG